MENSPNGQKITLSQIQMDVNFIDRFATWQNDEVEVDLAILVDDIKFKDVFGMNLNSTQN